MNGDDSEHSAGVNADLGERFLKICAMTDERLKQMSPAERDRMLQIHLAATRSMGKKFILLCQMTDAFASVRRERLSKESGVE
jgi:hypothetical protein